MSTEATSRNAAAWHDLLRLATPQLGLFLTRQARRCGVDRRALHRKRRRGELETWYHGVQALIGFPETWDRRALAALLAGGADCVLSHWSAAYVHGLLDVRCPSRLDVTFPRGRKRALPGTRTHDSRHLTRADVTSVGRLRATTVEWTICDLARWLSDRQLERVVHDAWRRGLTDADRILRVASRRPRFPGRPMLLAILARSDPRLARSRSIYESAAFVAIRDAGLPLPDVNVEVELSDGSRYELDLAYLDQQLDIEADSRLHHSIAPDVERDQARQSALEDDGWGVERATNVEIRDDPQGFAERVRAALARRGHPRVEGRG